MNLLFDIDNTIAKTSPSWEDFSKDYLSRKGYKLIRPQFDAENIEDNYEMTKQQKGLYMRFMWEHFDFRHLEPTEGAVETLAELVKRGHQIDFITARVDATWLQTSQWFNEHFKPVLTPIYRIHFLKDLPPKNTFDVLIDDSIERIRMAQEKGQAVILVDPTCKYEGNDIPTVRKLPELLTLTEVIKDGRFA